MRDHLQGSLLEAGFTLGDNVADRLLPIDKVSRQTGIASSALRYYERCGLIAQGTKIGGKRHYSPSVLNRLYVIRVCQAVGFSLREISEILDMSSMPGMTWRTLVQRRMKDIECQIRRLQNHAMALSSALNCGCVRLTECPEMGPEGDLARLVDDIPSCRLDMLAPPRKQKQHTH